MAWKKPTTPSDKNAPAFPGLKSQRGSNTKYAELQQNELIALEAIYGDDFTRLKEAHSAWKKSEPSFTIRITAASDEDFSCTLRVIFTATYPKSPPLITLVGELRDATKFKLEKYLQAKPKELASEEQEMMHPLIEGIRDILEDDAQAKARGEQVSLEEERARHEAMLERQAREQEEEARRKNLEKSREEDRAMAGAVQEELRRKEEVARTYSKSRRSSEILREPDGPKTEKDDSIVIFDRTCRVGDIAGKEFHFTTVECGSVFGSGPLSAVHHCLPSVAKASSCPPLALKKTVLRFSANEPVRNYMITLEDKLTMLQSIHHRHLVDVVGFMIHEELAVDKNFLHRFWTVQVLNQKAQMTSLESFLEICDHLHISKVRSFARDLLDAMAFLHNHGIIHHDVHPRNVLIFKESTLQATQTVAKLSDAVYQHLLYQVAQKGDSPIKPSSSRSPFWMAPETVDEGDDQYTHKTDLWDLGVIVMQMMFGLDIVQQYNSPSAFMKAHSLSKPLKEMMIGFFDPDPKRRPKAFDLGCTEFLTTDAPIFTSGGLVTQRSRLQSFSSTIQQLPPRIGLENTKELKHTGRYEAEFIEEGRLGKGGFGQVVKARKKLDGGVFAIKIIHVSTKSTLTEVLKEVALISKLNHPAVVRYYDAWVDTVADDSFAVSDSDDDDEELSDAETEGTTESGPSPMAPSGGLDFMSSSGYPEIEFGYDTGEEDEDGQNGNGMTEETEESEEATDEQMDSTSPNQLRNVRSHEPAQRVLYISMEYCDRRTLRDLVNGDLYKSTSEIWRLFRQILSGLRHIHSLSIVHRDLKPENILITQGLKGEDCVKIADFGLATMGQFVSTKPGATSSDPDQITRSLGTKLYTAPEVRSTASGTYSAKVDMFSLGVILFEMCCQPMTGMERVIVLSNLRLPSHILPDGFKPGDRNQTEIILSLVAHNPDERPDSATLLRNPKIPIDGEEEFTRSILAGGVEPDSPYYREILATFFAGFSDKARDMAWDIEMPGPAALKKIMTDDIPLQKAVKENLEMVFHRHGALAVNRSKIYPRSRHYANNVVRLLGSDGTVLQLPYDLTMGLARLLAKHPATMPADKVYTFGTVFRSSKGMGQPVSLTEVDFDIISSNSRDLALKEAELLKVLDEIIHTLPPAQWNKMNFFVGHSNILHSIFDFCKVDRSLRRKTAEIISKLHVHGCTWQKTRQELRSEEVGVSATSVNELEKFDFKGPPAETFARLKDLFKGSDLYPKVVSTIGHINDIVDYANKMGVKTPIDFNPFCSVRESFYSGGMLFSCTSHGKAKEVFAAGGRYDSLIQEFRLSVGDGRDQERRRAVGFSLSWHTFVNLSKIGSSSAHNKRLEHESLQPGRVDVLVTSTDDLLRRSLGLEVLGTLWDNGISAELASNAGSTDELAFNVKDDDYSWLVVVKPDKSLRIKTMKRTDVPDEDMPMSHLLTWLQPKIQERDILASRAKSAVQREHSSGVARRGHDQEVSVLVSQQKNKKMMRQSVIDQAQSSAAGFVEAMANGPILGVETSDGALTLIQSTPLSTVDGWKKLEQAAGSGGKGYVRQIHDELSGWKLELDAEKRQRHCFIYNFRTGKIIYYDLSI